MSETAAAPAAAWVGCGVAACGCTLASGVGESNAELVFALDASAGVRHDHRRREAFAPVAEVAAARLGSAQLHCRV